MSECKVQKTGLYSFDVFFPVSNFSSFKPDEYKEDTIRLGQEQIFLSIYPKGDSQDLTEEEDGQFVSAWYKSVDFQFPSLVIEFGVLNAQKQKMQTYHAVNSNHQLDYWNGIQTSTSFQYAERLAVQGVVTFYWTFDFSPLQNILCSLASSLQMMYDPTPYTYDPRFSDCSIRIHNCVLPAHRIVLSRQSPVFETLFQSTTESSHQEIVPSCVTVSALTWARFIVFLYQCSFEYTNFPGLSDVAEPYSKPQTFPDYLEIYKLARHYRVRTLEVSCHDALLKNGPDPLRSFFLYEIGEIHNDDVLKNRAWAQFILLYKQTLDVAVPCSFQEDTLLPFVQKRTLFRTLEHSISSTLYTDPLFDSYELSTKGGKTHLVLRTHGDMKAAIDQLFVHVNPTQIEIRMPKKRKATDELEGPETKRSCAQNQKVSPST